jgi:diacylglycerol kinase family enzyme
MNPARILLVADRSAAASIATRAAIVTVNLLRDGAAGIPTRHRLDGGELALHALREAGLRTLVRAARIAITGDWSSPDTVHHHRARELTVRVGRRRARVLLDGERFDVASPLRFQVRPRALDVLAP